MKLCQGRFTLDIRKVLFTQSMAGHQNRLPREGVTAPVLTEFENMSSGSLVKQRDIFRSFQSITTCRPASLGTQRVKSWI